MKRTLMALLMAATVLVAGPTTAARAAGSEARTAEPAGVELRIGQGIIRALLGGHERHRDDGGTPRADEHGWGGDQGHHHDHDDEKSALGRIRTCAHGSGGRCSIP